MQAERDTMLLQLTEMEKKHADNAKELLQYSENDPEVLNATSI